jgi:hypothetical protein
MCGFAGFPGSSPGFGFRMDCIHPLRHPPVMLCLPGLSIGMNFAEMFSPSGIPDFPLCCPCRFMNGPFDGPGRFAGILFHLFHIKILMGQISQNRAEEKTSAQHPAMMPSPKQQITQ